MKDCQTYDMCGPRGHCVSRGYHEIDCADGVVRIYNDQLVILDRGQHVISKGTVETTPKQRDHHGMWR
jgi:hypothetical protein